MQRNILRVLQAAIVLLVIAIALTSALGQTKKKGKKKTSKPRAQPVAECVPLGSAGVADSSVGAYAIEIYYPVIDTMPSREDFISVEQEPYPIQNIQSLVEYPEEAKRKGLEGKVIVSALIDVYGNVVKVEVDKSDYAVFEEAAKKAMMKARFTPAWQNGEPVKLWYTVPIVFCLHGTAENVVAVRNFPLLNESVPDSLTYKHHFYQQTHPLETPARSVIPIETIAEYPPYLIAEGIEGQVMLSVLVDTNGNLKDYKFEYSDHPHFELSIKDVIGTLKFIPAEVGGRKVEKWSSIVVNFKLSGEPKK
jgi:TonB family protein